MKIKDLVTRYHHRQIKTSSLIIFHLKIGKRQKQSNQKPSSLLNKKEKINLNTIKNMKIQQTKVNKNDFKPNL